MRRLLDVSFELLLLVAGLLRRVGRTLFGDSPTFARRYVLSIVRREAGSLVVRYYLGMPRVQEGRLLCRMHLPRSWRLQAE